MNDPATILIVEDEVFTAHILRVWLERHGYRTLEAQDGAGAMKMLTNQETRIDAVISDANMPVMDGVALLKAIREELGLSIPFLLLTARCDQEKLAAKLDQHDTHIYPKPFMPSHIVLEIRRLLEAAPARN